MKFRQNIIKISGLLMLILVGSVNAQQNLAQEAYAIIEDACLICHGENGSFSDDLLIEYTVLIEDGSVVPEDPGASVFYQRLIETDIAKRMPLGQPPLDPAAIETIHQWIAAGAPDWDAIPKPKPGFITNDTLLEAVENHVNSLSARDKSFARYFTLTHLYNAGETTEALNAYRRALSKLINSLSWGRKVVKPQPIDTEQTIFYIDLRDYEWDVRNDAWTQIEQAYPYKMTFDAPTQTHLREKLTTLQQEMNCEVPFINVDWFLATASLPPLYHDILALPETDRELEASLEVFVAENLQNAPGKRVWRAGFNNSRVSRHNRVLERHISRYGAYWKSYDFAGSSESQSVFTHPLDFSQDGGEIIFNLPNGLQAYFIVDREGIRIDAAPISIVSNPAVADPTVRTGLSCIGCHTKGMQTFEDEVRAVVEQADNPPFNKERALDLYVEQTEMDELVAEDMKRFRVALEETGGVFGGIEPVQRLHEAFQGTLSAAHAAAAVGLETEVFLEKISKNVSLQNLLGALVLENGAIKRDAWTSAFHDVIAALDSPDSVLPPVVERPEIIPGAGVYIPDPNLRSTIEEALSKAADDVITVEDMTTLTTLRASNRYIRDLTGIQYAINLENLWISGNPITDLSPLAALKNLIGLAAWDMAIEDFSPLAELTNLKWLELFNTPISDISPLAPLTSLERLSLYGTGTENLAPLAGLTSLIQLQIADNERLSDVSALASLINLEWLDLHRCDSLSDISSLAGLSKLEYLNLNHTRRVYDYSLSPLSGLTGLRRLRLAENRISDVSSLAGVIGLERLDLPQNQIVDISPLSGLTGLTELYLHANSISDVSSLAGLINLEWLDLRVNQIADISALDGLAARTYISWVENPGAPIGGTKIEGPWLWVPIPEKQLDNRTDLLSEVSGGSVTEHQIATRGATEGKVVGNYEWAAHKISPVGTYDGFINNMSEMVRAFGLPEEYEWSTEVIAVYGSVILDSPREQQTRMFVGSEGRNKVWLNGELVYEQLIRPTEFDYWWDDSDGFNQYFPVTLKPGANVLLVAVGNGNTITGHFGFEEGTEYTLLPPSEIDIPDPNLRAVIAEALDKEDNVPITLEEIATLTILRASNRDIKDLTGIEAAVNLEELWISENPVSDLSPLAGLKNLIGLGVWDTPNIFDLSPLTKLPKLRWLDFGRFPAPDLSILADIKSLRRLTFHAGGIEDLSPLAGLTQLTILDIAYNSTAPDLFPITKLTNLEKFVANTCGISDITPLAALTKLKHLDLHNNLISDVSPLAKLVNLEMVKLYGNLISDISSLESSPIFPYVFWLENPGSARSGPQIEGPWTWLKLPAEHFDTDWLAEASGGTVTEQQVATYGAKDGQHVGDNVWKSAKIGRKGVNVLEMLSLAGGEHRNKYPGKPPLIYSTIVLNSPREQKTKILEGSQGVSVKIWLNGDLVHKAVGTRSGARLYDRFSPVTLKKGANVLLVATLNLHERYYSLCSVGFDEGTEYTVLLPDIAIPDPNLRAVIEEALGKTAGDVIMVEEMEALTELIANRRDIRDLTGLEFATNLEVLAFPSNPVADISPLGSLTKLRKIDITHSDISDLSPLQGLTGLKRLLLYGSKVTDISPLEGLTGLVWFGIQHSGPITDFSPVTSLTNLQTLNLAGTGISDLSPLTTLTNLKTLHLEENQIEDVSPLASLTNLEKLTLHYNNIKDFSPLDSIRDNVEISWYGNPSFPVGGPKIEGPWSWVLVPGRRFYDDTDLLLQASGGAISELDVATNGVTVGTPVGENVWTAHKIASTGGDNINALLSAVDMERHENLPSVIYGSVVLRSPREQKINMFAGSDLDHKVWLNGEFVHQNFSGVWAREYQDFFPVTLKEGINVLLVAVLGTANGEFSGYFGFDEGTEYTLLPPAEVAIPDPNLRAVIAKELGKDDSAFISITADEMAALTVISAEDAGIKDLSGLEFATNLVHLNVRFNSITDISPIKGLNELKELRLRGNQISDFSVLTELESLKELWISGEKITDFSSLAELTNLEGFGAWGLYIDDISSLSGFTKLRWLELGHNHKELEDISPLANLKGLKRLVLYSMGVEDISPLASLKGLKNLTIVANRVKDVLPLAELTELVFLDLSGNDIWDFSPIEGLFGKIPISTADNPGFPTEGPKIEGPWLWVLAPIYGMSTMDAAISGTDFLAQMSNGAVTELEIATEGAKEGDSVGNGVWTVGKLSSSVGNINDMVNATSLEISDTNHHIAYGSIILGSPKDQKVNMLIGTSESVKIWLNGELIHNHPTGGSIEGYTGFLPVTLQKGANVVLVAIYERREGGEKQGWTGFFGFEDGTEYTVVPPGVGLSFSSTVKTLLAGDRLTLNLNAENISDLAGWQTDITFDPNVFEAVEVTEGDFLMAEGGDTFFRGGTIDNTAGKITSLFSARISETGVDGSGILLSVTFKAKTGGETQITLENFEFISIRDEIIPVVPPNITITVGEYPAWDVNQDGRVSITDLVLVARCLGKDTSDCSQADVNRDGVVNVQDLILVEQHMGESTDSAASPVLAMDNEELMLIMVQAWIDQARAENDGSLAFRQGIENLQKLLASLLPEKTALFANYPNPFNPETWIPYQLAKPVDVTLTIYAANGAVVRTLALGHQAAGIYQSRSRAAYWDGRNDVGESVASGIYFYTLTAGDFTATRKMLILK